MVKLQFLKKSVYEGIQATVLIPIIKFKHLISTPNLHIRDFAVFTTVFSAAPSIYDQDIWKSIFYTTFAVVTDRAGLPEKCALLVLPCNATKT